MARKLHVDCLARLPRTYTASKHIQKRPIDGWRGPPLCSLLDANSAGGDLPAGQVFFCILPVLLRRKGGGNLPFQICVSVFRPRPLLFSFCACPSSCPPAYPLNFFLISSSSALVTCKRAAPPFVTSPCPTPPPPCGRSYSGRGELPCGGGGACSTGPPADDSAATEADCSDGGVGDEMDLTDGGDDDYEAMVMEAR
eukprot:363596-Chlamydomonas_euryale.AAC.3